MTRNYIQTIHHRRQDIGQNNQTICSLIFLSIIMMTTINSKAQNNIVTRDYTSKSVLARACDPAAAKHFANLAPSLLGNAEYFPATNDEDFVKQLETRKWSVIFFAPGACRIDAADQQIPGSNSHTQGWSLEEYKVLVRKLQGDQVQIVESFLESETVRLLNKALEKAPETR